MKDIVGKMNELLHQPKFLETFYQVDTDEIEMADKVKQYLTQIQMWNTNFVSKGNSQQSAPLTKPVLTEVIDIEENIWSPFLGFKGLKSFQSNVINRFYCFKDFMILTQF